MNNKKKTCSTLSCLCFLAKNRATLSTTEIICSRPESRHSENLKIVSEFMKMFESCNYSNCNMVWTSNRKLRCSSEHEHNSALGHMPNLIDQLSQKTLKKQALLSTKSGDVTVAQ